MTHLVFLLIAFVVALTCGALVELWSFCLGDPMHGSVTQGRIFSGLGRYLLTRYEAVELARERRNAKLRNAYVNDARERHRLKSPGKPFEVTDELLEGAPMDLRPNWWKITGVCPKCAVVWAGFLTYAGLVLTLAPSPWWWCGLFNFAGAAFVGLQIAHRLRD